MSDPEKKKFKIPSFEPKPPEHPEPKFKVKVISNNVTIIKNSDVKHFEIMTVPDPNVITDEPSEHLLKLQRDLRELFMRNMFSFTRGGGNSIVNHFALLNKGIKTHAEIDTHIGLTTSAHGGLLANVVEDLTPQLGGDLDLNDKNLDVKTTNTSSIGETGKALKELFTRIIECDSGDLIVKTPTAKTMQLNTPVYNDLVIPISSGKVPSPANYPAWTTFSANLNSYTFAVDDYIDLQSIELLHNWKEGTEIDLHVHLITNGLNNATARKVKYTVFYSMGDKNEVMSAEDSKTAEIDIAANLPDRTHLYLDLGHITMTNYKIGTTVKLRLKRIAGTGTEPAANPFVEMIGIHYQIDTVGSREETIK